MALNQVMYLPNPAGVYNKTVGTELTATGAAATTIQAAIAASTYVRVRNFTICLTAIGDATSEYITGVLTIGAGKYTVTASVASGATTSAQFSSADLGFDGAWLQPTDTITFRFIEDGAGAVTGPRASVSVALEDFTV